MARSATVARRRIIGAVSGVLICLGLLMIGNSFFSPWRSDDRSLDGLDDGRHPVGEVRREGGRAESRPEVLFGDASKSPTNSSTTFLVIDKRSRRVLEDVALLGAVDQGEDVALGRTGADGRLEVKVAGAMFEAIKFTLPEDLGGETGIERTGAPDEEGLIRIEAAAFAELEINLSAPNTRSNDARVSVMPYVDSTKLSDGDADATLLATLRFDPELLEMSLLRRGRKHFTFREKTRIAPELCRAVVYVPYTGSVRVAVVEPDFQTAVARCDVVRGEVRAIDLPLFLPPVAGGVLVDENDRPMPGKTVAIRFHSTFAGDELVPRSDDDAKECGVAILSDRSDPSRATVYLKRVVVTDAEGRFQSPLSYSDRVAAWSFDAEHGVAYCDAALGSRTADWRNIRLKFSGLPNRPLSSPVRLATGDPARERTYFVYENPGHPFQFEYPDLKTDTEGNLDTRYLKVGQRYGMVEIGGSGKTSEFVFQPGMTILR